MENSLTERATASVAALSGRWTIRILYAMKDGPVRTSDLCRAIPEASKKMIIDNLHRLERLGLVKRHDLSKLVKHVEYEMPEDLRIQTMALLMTLAGFSRTDVR